jgi:anti-anti-sigma factor
MTQQKQHLGGIELTRVSGQPAIRGECHLANAAAIEAWLATFDVEPLNVDLSGVTFFDSTALEVLLNARRRNQHMRVVNPSKAVLKVLNITGTRQYLVDAGTPSRKPLWIAGGGV